MSKPKSRHKSEQTLERAPRKVVRVSLPKAFGEELRAQAKRHGRSMAAQLEHWARIAMAVEAFNPGPAIHGITSVPLTDAAALRLAFARCLGQSSLQTTAAQLAAANLPSFGMSPSRPGVIVRTDPDGTQSEGHLDAQGIFVSETPSSAQSPSTPGGAAKGKRRKSPSRAGS